MATQLAAEEINAAGGLLGRKIQVIQYDTQSDIALYTKYAQQLARDDKVDVVHGGITSASREAIRQTFRRANILYFYNVLYEGGVCDRNCFVTGTTPAQAVEPIVEISQKQWGKKVYVLAADYNYGQITAKWVAHYVKQRGGSVLQTDFFPLDVADFGSTIAKIQAAKPDSVCAALVGGAHLSFFRQWAASGMNKKIPLYSTTFGVGNEHLALSPAEGDGILIAGNYSQEEPTPANKDFLARWGKRFGDTKIVHEIAVSQYQGIKLWAEAVQEGRLARPRQADQGARVGHQRSRARPAWSRWTGDAPRRARHQGDGGEGPEADDQAGVQAAPAERHRGVVQPGEEPEREQAVRGDDLGRAATSRAEPHLDYAAVVFLEILYMIAFLALISAGLAVVFGMMRVINLAHGEFVMIGGYMTIFANRAGIDIWFAMLVLAPLVVGVIGLVVERVVIRHLYGRMIDTMLATWGLSLLMVGLVTLIFGNTAVSVPRRSSRTRSAPTRWAATTCSSSPSRSCVMLVLWLRAAPHAHRAGRARRDAERRRRLVARLRPAADLHVDLHCRRRALGARRRRDGAAHRPPAVVGVALHRQGVHHRHHRRRGDHLRARWRARSSSARSTRSSRSARRR